MLPAYEAKDSKTVNNPIEAYIVAEVFSLQEIMFCNLWFHYDVILCAAGNISGVWL